MAHPIARRSAGSDSALRADQKFKLVDTNVWHVERHPARAQPRPIAPPAVGALAVAAEGAVKHASSRSSRQMKTSSSARSASYSKVRPSCQRPARQARLVPRHLAAQKGSGAACRRLSVAVRIERDQRIPRRDHCAAAAPGGSRAARHQPRLDRLRADLRRARDRRGLCRRRGRRQELPRQNPGSFRAAGACAREAGCGSRYSTARNIR